jgi:hypothetical protein
MATGKAKVEARVSVWVPAETARAISKDAFDKRMTIRGIILLALRRAGYPVAEGAECDGRRRS